MRTYWLGIRNTNNDTDIRGPFSELNDALKETKFFKPYAEFEFIVFFRHDTHKRLAIVEANKIWTTPALLEDHVVEGWAGYAGSLEHGIFKCRNCGVRCRVWKGSVSYKHQLCAKCLDAAGLGITLRKLN